MSDDLVIAGGGSTAVEVDTLFVDASRLGAAEASIEGWLDRFAAIRSRLAVLEPVGVGGALAGDSTALRLADAGSALADAQQQVRSMRIDLVESAERYGATERFVSALWDLGGQVGAVALGAATPAIALVALGASVNGLVAALPFVLPALSALGIASLLGAKVSMGVPTGPFSDWLTEHRGVLSDPMFVRLVRTAADHVDDAVLTATVGAPFAPLGGLLHAPDSASVLLGAAGLASGLGMGGGRLLTDRQGVRVERVAPERNPTDAAPPTGRFPVPAPTGVGDLAHRVPPSDGAAQITVERYRVDGEDRWIVYIGGTVDFTLEAGDQTSDMTSNVHGVADFSAYDRLRVAGADSAAAEQAVRAALTEAGASPGDPLVAIGHSGGGVIAAGLASDPELDVVAAASLGGPVASAPIRAEVPFLSVEHAEDLVPATAGSGGALGAPSDRLVVSRSVLEPGGDDGGDLIPAHRLTRYQETADLIDRSEEERIVAFRDTVTAFTGGASGERTRWRASRE